MCRATDEHLHVEPHHLRPDSTRRNVIVTVGTATWYSPNGPTWREDAASDRLPVSVPLSLCTISSENPSPFEPVSTMLYPNQIGMHFQRVRIGRLELSRLVDDVPVDLSRISRYSMLSFGRDEADTALTTTPHPAKTRT